jgi:hypothetical protein
MKQRGIALSQRDRAHLGWYGLLRILCPHRQLDAHGQTTVGVCPGVDAAAKARSEYLLMGALKSGHSPALLAEV